MSELKSRAVLAAAKLAREGKTLAPIPEIPGRKIATTFWGQAWCDALESYSDYETRLPRGRSYVRNGLVIDLEITAAKVTGLVCGSRLYTVTIDIAKLKDEPWREVIAASAGRIDSVLRLLAGELPDEVLAILAREQGGLFPSPREIRFACTCPDVAQMCKHVASVLYGVGARLDREPALFFVLRGVDQEDLITKATIGRPAVSASGKSRTIDRARLGEIFGITLDEKRAKKRGRTR
jgi:uncharacterized Zn finger protein